MSIKITSYGTTEFFTLFTADFPVSSTSTWHPCLLNIVDAIFWLIILSSTTNTRGVKLRGISGELLLEKNY